MNEDDPKLKLRRTYGRGFLDGLRAAGVDDPENFMNTTKVQAAVLGQTGVARKVYDVVPFDTPAPATALIAAMRERGQRLEFSVLEGCLATLKAAKLIKETSGGFFRETPRIRTPSKAAPLPPESPTPVETPQDPLSRIAVIAAAMRNFAQQLDDIALEVHEKTTKTDSASEKLKQLRDLLKDA